MLDTSMSGMAYNRLSNLDGIEDRIIYHLLNKSHKTEKEQQMVDTIWRILLYNDVDALKESVHPSDGYEFDDIEELICEDNSTSQSEKRIFRSPRLEDGWTEECSLIKVYIDSIIPQNHLNALVNIGIDVVVNSKIINLAVPNKTENTFIDVVDGHTIHVKTKSRVTTLTQNIIALLNGANVQGVGKVVFDREQSITNKAQYGLWNNRNYEGMKIVMGVYMSGVD